MSSSASVANCFAVILGILRANFGVRDHGKLGSELPGRHELPNAPKGECNSRFVEQAPVKQHMYKDMMKLARASVKSTSFVPWSGPYSAVAMNRAGAAAPYLGQWARALSTSPMALAVPATATRPSSLLGLGSKKVPPLTVPLLGIEPVTPASVSAALPPTETASLANGVRLGTQDVMVRAAFLQSFVAASNGSVPGSDRPSM
jgi:hypothetical protein